MKSGIELIAIERQDQIEKHGRTLEMDALENSEGQLAFAAEILCSTSPFKKESCLPKGWDFYLFQKMVRKNRIDQLVIAAALIAAEIDRLNQMPVKGIDALKEMAMGNKPS